MDYNDKETMTFYSVGFDGVTRMISLEEESGITLPQVADAFAAFLRACGYDYVTGIDITTEYGHTNSNNAAGVPW